MIKLKLKKHVLSLITYTKLNSMNLKLIRFLIICVFAMFSAYLQAQIKLVKDEYQAEIGVACGGNFYIGEANSKIFNNMRMAYSGFFRYRIDERFALKAELTSAIIAGSGIKDNQVYVGDFTGEFNFFDLEQNPYKQFSKTYTPYVFFGLSLVTDVHNKESLSEVGLPFGVGLKIKLSNRWNLNTQWSNRLMFADNLEGTDAGLGTNNPNKLNGSNIFNNDFLSTFTVGVSFDIWKKPCDCLKNK